MLTAEISQPKLAEGAKRSATDTTYPFNKMSIWFEDFSLKQPERSGKAAAAVF
jgi:hypothetical protein